MLQNQPFIDPLQNRNFWIISKIRSKKPVLESLFNKVAVLRTCHFNKEVSSTGVFLWNLQTFEEPIILKNMLVHLLLNFISKETHVTHVRLMFSCEFCELFKNTFFVEDLRNSGSETPLRGSLFNKVGSLTAWTYLTGLERDSSKGISLWILWWF